MGSGETTATGTSAGDLGWPLRRAEALSGRSDAIVDGDRTVSYFELAHRVRALGAAIDELAVPVGGRIGFLGVNSLAHVECTMGIPAAGRTLVDLNFRLAEAELAFISADCGLEALVVDRTQLEVARRLRASCRTLRQLVLDDPGPCPEDCVPYEQLLDRDPVERPSVDEGALAAISYTGGTTGPPKGVMLSHANLLANARHNLIATGHTGTDRWLHVCPMFHVAGTANIFACTWVGARQIVLPRFEARSVIATLRREAVTHTVLVPTMIAMLLDELELGREHERQGLVPSLRHLQYAGSPIAPALQRRLLATLDCDIAQFYGMTEAAPTVTHLTPEDHRRGSAGAAPYSTRLAGIGAPVVGVQAEVRTSDGSPVSVGEIGELWVRGPNVMLGYWNRPDATDAAVADGWYRTGDAARADEDGYLYLVDRLKDMIISGGENVYSVEVEAALLEHQGVLEAAVFGIPDLRWGESVHAVVAVTAADVVSSGELVEHCRELIASYKVPRSIEVRTEPLPKSGAGKLLKHRLREPFWAGRDRRIN